MITCPVRFNDAIRIVSITNAAQLYVNDLPVTLPCLIKAGDKITCDLAAPGVPATLMAEGTFTAAEGYGWNRGKEGTMKPHGPVSPQFMRHYYGPTRGTPAKPARSAAPKRSGQGARPRLLKLGDGRLTRAMIGWRLFGEQAASPAVRKMMQLALKVL